jgi:hypothetical protein
VRSLVHARAAHFTRRDVCVDPGELYPGSAHRRFLLNHGLANRAAPEEAGAADQLFRRLGRFGSLLAAHGASAS